MFEIGIIVLAVILYIGFGCAVDLQIIWKVIKRPIAPAIGFLSQFVVMPLVSKDCGMKEITFCSNVPFNFLK